MPTYIPFERLSAAFLERSLAEGRVYWVLQRFPWPGIAAGRAFIATTYDNEAQAQEHEKALEPGEGKLLRIRADEQKIRNLQQEDSGYVLFSNTFADEDWDDKMSASFGRKIENYIRYVSPVRARGRMQVSINFTLLHGRLMAVISGNGKTDNVPVYEMIK
jgi:hypothetical protein